jgi:hypothetical protein
MQMDLDYGESFFVVWCITYEHFRGDSSNTVVDSLWNKRTFAREYPNDVELKNKMSTPMLLQVHNANRADVQAHEEVLPHRFLEAALDVQQWSSLEAMISIGVAQHCENRHQCRLILQRFQAWKQVEDRPGWEMDFS